MIDPFILEIDENFTCGLCANEKDEKNFISTVLIITLLELDVNTLNSYSKLTDFKFSGNSIEIMKDYLAFLYSAFPYDEASKALTDNNYKNELLAKRKEWFVNFKKKLNSIITNKENVKKYLIGKEFNVNTKIKNEKGKLREFYYFHCIKCFVYWALWQYSNSKLTLSKCENCGKYFFPRKRSDEKYCDRVTKNGKTCKQIGYSESKLKTDSIKSLYRKIYKTQNARKQRNKENIIDIDKKFLTWHNYAKKQLELCKNSKISVEELKNNISSSDWLRGDNNADN